MAENNSNASATAMTIAPDLLTRIIFADGVAGLQVVNGVAHFDLYQHFPAQPREGQQAPRVVTHRLALPVTAIPQLVSLLKALDDKVRAAQPQQTRQ